MGTLNGRLKSLATNSSYALIDWTGLVGAMHRFSFFASSRHFRFGCGDSVNGLLNGLRLLKLFPMTVVVCANVTPLLRFAANWLGAKLFRYRNNRN